MNKFEKPSEDGRYEEGPAHDEANLLQAQAEKMRRKEAYSPEFLKVTAEDYDEALEKLEDLQSLVAEGESNIGKIGRSLNALIQLVPTLVVGELGTKMVNSIQEGVYHAIEGTVKGMKEGWKEGGLRTKADLEEIFLSPKKRLEILRDEAKKKEAKK